MQWSELFPRNYLNATDIPPGGIAGQILQIILEDVAGNGKAGDHKPVLYLSDLDKGIVVNKTNGTILRECFGDTVEAAIGKYLQVRQGKVMFSGKLVPSVMLIPQDGPAPTQQHQRPEVFQQSTPGSVHAVQ